MVKQSESLTRFYNDYAQWAMVGRPYNNHFGFDVEGSLIHALKFWEHANNVSEENSVMPEMKRQFAIAGLTYVWPFGLDIIGNRVHANERPRLARNLAEWVISHTTEIPTPCDIVS